MPFGEGVVTFFLGGVGRRGVEWCGSEVWGALAETRTMVVLGFGVVTTMPGLSCLLGRWLASSADSTARGELAATE